MPHKPRKFIDKEHAEMMVYALEEHFLLITTLLDNNLIPKQKADGTNLTVYQRVWMLANQGWATHAEMLAKLPEDEEGEDPEEVAVKIWDLYHPPEVSNAT